MLARVAKLENRAVLVETAIMQARQSARRKLERRMAPGRSRVTALERSALQGKEQASEELIAEQKIVDLFCVASGKRSFMDGPRTRESLQVEQTVGKGNQFAASGVLRVKPGSRFWNFAYFAPL